MRGEKAVVSHTVPAFPIHSFSAPAFNLSYLDLYTASPQINKRGTPKAENGDGGVLMSWNEYNSENLDVP